MAATVREAARCSFNGNPAQVDPERTVKALAAQDNSVLSASIAPTTIIKAPITANRMVNPL